MIPLSYGGQSPREVDAAERTDRGGAPAGRAGARHVAAGLGALVERAADAWPDRIAVISGDGRTTYAALDEQANRLAHHLRRQGAGRGTAVGICQGSGPEPITARLAVAKTGAAYVAVDSADAAELVTRPEFRPRVGVVLGRAADLARIRGELPSRVGLVALDDDAPLIAGRPAARPSLRTTEDDVALLTRRQDPSGQSVWELVPHRALVHRDGWWAALPHGGTCTITGDEDRSGDGEDAGPRAVHGPVGADRAFVLDARLRPVPPGVVGDLYLAGEGLGHGYAGRPSATALHFVAHTLGRPGARMYRSGERARWNHDGSLDLVPQDAGRAPELLIPGRAVGEAVAPAAPRTSRQEILCGIFAEMLGLHTVGIHDDFFDLGGHSLLAARIAGRVRGLFGIELDLSAVFRAPTVARLDAAVGRSEQVRVPLRPVVHRPDLLPASPGQQGMWMLDQIQGPNASYNIPTALRLTGPLDAEALEAAVRDVVVRHEALRTTFRNHDGVPHQYVVPDAEARVRLERASCDHAGLPSALRAFAARAFDLSDDLPIRALLVELGPEEHALLLLTHHIASDGASQDPLLRDLSTAYAARLATETPRWGPLPVQYADFALWQHDVLGSEDDPGSAAARHLGHWKRELAGLPEELALPYDRPRPGAPSFRGDLVPVAVGADLHGRLLALARRHEVTMLMVLQTGLAALLSRIGAGTDVPLGTVVAGRTEESLDRLVGYFTNTLVLRTDLSGNPTISELLGRVRETDLAAFENQNAPFERLVELLNPDRSASRHPLFQTMLVLQGRRTAPASWPGLRTKALEVGNGTAKFDLSLWLHEEFDGAAPAGMTGSFEYSADLFDRTTVEALVSRLVRVLEAMTETPDARLSQIDVLSPAETRSLRELSGSAPADNLPSACVPELFEAQARLRPDAVALTQAGRHLGYGELNSRANRLGRHLLDIGVTRGTPVGVCLESGLDQVVALLAVLKAGACCVPLDPASSAEDTARVLQDAGAHVVIARNGAPAGARVGSVVYPDGDTPSIDRLSAGNLGLRGHHSAPACVTVAAGEGRTERVVLSHRAVVATYGPEHRPEFGPDDVFLQWAPLGTRSNVAALLGALLHGARCVLPPEQAPDPAVVGQLLGEHRVTVLRLPANLFGHLIEDHPAALRSVRYAYVDADSTYADELADKLRKFPGLRVFRGYGPAEDAGLSASNEIVAEESAAPRVPVGTPVAGKQVHVLGPGLELLPLGSTGELHVAGLGLALGYLGRPGRTAERFLPNPYGAPGDRLFRTGTFGRRRHDGVLEVVGATREDVQAAEETPGRLTPGDADATGATAPEGRPRTERQRFLCSLFEEVLEASGVGLHDNFFDLGGHSLLASRLIVRIRSQLGIKASIGDVMAAPTVAELAERLELAPKVRPRRTGATG
ncbi:condensation domain-containing protein [Streptomyces sp. b84]|uniref:condensation domain-containing protein n=1 Tax=Streptomyces sp. b84 TaxID=1827631 RepID=UPI000BF0ADD9|nr:condensation domain-containing protein [Streptomyces sp. b84]